MYKFIALDVDGTLLNSQKKVSKSTIEAIEKAIEMGVLVSICTGRPVQGAASFVELFQLESPIIAYNGGMIVDSKTNEILYEQGLDADKAREILAFGKQRETTIIIWSNNKLYVNVLNNHVDNYKMLSDVQPIVVRDYEEVIRQGITKILWIDEVKTIQTYKHEMQAQFQGSINVCTSKAHYLEFMDRRVSKGAAMERIGEIYGIKQDEMMAIGDGENDLPMLRYAGLGVAMGNAPEVVKEESDFVAASNDEDGIAKTLQKFIFTA